MATQCYLLAIMLGLRALLRGVAGSRVTSGEVKAIIGVVPAQITNWIWS